MTTQSRKTMLITGQTEDLDISQPPGWEMSRSSVYDSLWLC